MLLALSSAILPACGAEGTREQSLHPGETLELRSEHGLVTGRIGAERIETGRNAFTMTFDPESTEVVDVSAFMPAHGHGAPGVRIVAVSSGAYRVEDVVLSMSGLWDVTVDLRLGESTDSLAFSVDVP